MAGLSFVDDVDVTVDTPLLPTFTGWLVDQAGSKAPTTVRAYVFDIALIAQVILEDQGRAPTQAELEALPLPARPLAGVSPEALARATGLVSRLTLGDMHPENLARAFATFGAATPGRRVAAGAAGVRRRDSTRRRAAAAWTTLCEYATVRGMFAANPMRDPRIVSAGKPALNPTPFELSEADALLTTVATPDVARTSRKPWAARDVALLSVLLTTGIRLSEACAVAIADVRDVASDPRIHVMGKGSKPRTVPLARATAEVLAEYIDERTQKLGAPEAGAPLFVHADGRAFTSRSMSHLVYRWYERAGVVPRGDSCVHALRHTFATHAINSGVSIVELQELLGHVSLETTKRYLKAVGFGLRDAIEAHPSAAQVRSHRPLAAATS